MDYTCTTSFLAYMGYSVIEKRGLASALTGKYFTSNNYCLVLIEVLPRGREKSVFRCRVMGGRGCGKTTFCRSLVLKVNYF